MTRLRDRLRDLDDRVYARQATRSATWQYSAAAFGPFVVGASLMRLDSGAGRAVGLVMMGIALVFLGLALRARRADRVRPGAASPAPRYAAVAVAYLGLAAGLLSWSADWRSWPGVGFAALCVALGVGFVVAAVVTARRAGAAR